MSAIALCQQANSQVVLDWMTGLNGAECQAGQDKAGWDRAADHLVFSRTRSFANRVKNAQEQDVQLQCWWQHITIPQGNSITLNIRDGSLVDHFGHEVRIEWLWEVFFYVIDCPSDIFIVKGQNVGGTYYTWFYWTTPISGSRFMNGTFMYTMYRDYARDTASFGSISTLLSPVSESQVLIGVLGERITP